MLISDSHQFIFVHVRKAAGSSLRAKLVHYALPKPQSVLRKVQSRAGLSRHYHHHVFRAHTPIRVAKKLMPADRFEKYFKFAFVRNPWQRLVSEYEYLLRTPSHGRHARVKRLGSFSKFVSFQINRPSSYQWNAITDQKGELLIDKAYRCNDLEAGFEDVCERLNLKFSPLPKINMAPKVDWRKYYSDVLAETVLKHWQTEIDYFGFSFDRPQSKPQLEHQQQNIIPL